jgi:hypothetical protein
MYHIYVFAFELNRLIVYKIYLAVYKLGLTFVIFVMTVYMIYKCLVGTIGWRWSWMGIYVMVIQLEFWM